MLKKISIFFNNQIFDEKQKNIFRDKINYHNLKLNLDSGKLKSKNEKEINDIIEIIKNNKLDDTKKNELYKKCFYSIVTINNQIIKDNKKLCIISPIDSLLTFNVINAEEALRSNDYKEYNDKLQDLSIKQEKKRS